MTPLLISSIPPALYPMASLNQWITWQFVDRGEPKLAKVPTHPLTRTAMDPTDPSWWMPAEAALATAKATGMGLGFVFTRNDPFGFVDVDGCVTEGQDDWSAFAHEIMALFPRAAAERSISGRGLHVFGRCPTGFPEHGNRSSNWPGLEFYSHGRFAAIGYGQMGDAAEDCTAGFLELVRRLPKKDIDAAQWSSECRGTPLTDEEVISKATTAKGGFAFADLLNGDISKYPSASEADLALAGRLAFWCGCNCDQIKRIMLTSGLRRDKWDSRDDYLPGTILEAVSDCETVYTGRPPTPPAALEVETLLPKPIDAYNYVDPGSVGELFRDYVYVLDVNRVMTPKGKLINESQFKSLFSNRTFALDHTGQRVTKNAWKAYMEGECWTFPHADRLCFRPGDARSAIPEDGDVLANTWRDPKPTRRPGDPSPFLQHVRRMLPLGDDAEQLLCYMAACVQHQGTKFTWCPLIQGVQGNGKSLLAEILTRAIGGEYVHVLRSRDLGAKFNSWMQSTVLAVVEDLHFNGSEAALETVKPLITARRLSVERKGVDQSTEEISCNFILTSNHKDAIPLDPDERRWAVFCCAQQAKRDLRRCGMGPDYFTDLVAWLESGGFEVVAEYLWTRAIPDEMNPARGAVVAPETTGREGALAASRSIEGQLLADAIEDNLPGFRGGWVSSLAAMSLLRSAHLLQVSPQRLSHELTKLGYVRHPGIEGGKSPRHVPVEGGRPRLWVLDEHASTRLTGTGVVDAYEETQGYDTRPIGVLPAVMSKVSKSP